MRKVSVFTKSSQQHGLVFFNCKIQQLWIFARAAFFIWHGSRDLTSYLASARQNVGRHSRGRVTSTSSRNFSRENCLRITCRQKKQTVFGKFHSLDFNLQKENGYQQESSKISKCENRKCCRRLQTDLL